MKRIKLPVIIIISITLALAVLLLLFVTRPPVLVVTDEIFAALYGVERLQRQRLVTSLVLFRQVKPVVIADGASPDMVILAISEVSPRPECVLFARSQAPAARRFHEQFPEIPVVVLRGLVPVFELPPPDGFLCVYSTDRETDLYRAGLFAGVLGGMRRKFVLQADDQPESTARTCVLLQDRSVQSPERELFSRGVTEENPELTVVFINSAAGMPDMKDISCVVLTGTGSEYLERNPPMPLILFTWMDSALTAQGVVVQFDDSVWALTVPAVRMAVRQQAEGKIPSKPLIFSGKIADNSVSRVLKKLAKKMP